MADILIVDDEADIRDLISDLLADEGHSPRTADDADTAFAAIEQAAPNLIVLDIWLQGSRMDGIEILKSVKRDNPGIPVVIISGHGNIEVAVTAVRQGAYDFIEKPFNMDQLLVVVDRALEASRLRRENARLKNAEQGSSLLVGASAAMASLRSKLERVARGGSRVMLSGGPGTGKEVSARFIHANSERRDKPFVVVNAASIEPHLMEEVLFGREHDGRIERAGVFEQAHGGTLFFDEVGDMPAGTQSKILRVLVDQAFTRLGGASTVRVDVRVISASNRDLSQLIGSGAFREDLYHRLSVVPIDVPQLEQRREDIPELAEHFLEMFAREQGMARRSLSEACIATLQTREWPGNVRQLRNEVLRLDALATTDEIGPELLSEPVESSDGETLDLAALEQSAIQRALERAEGNKSEAARLLGISRRALYNKLERG